MLDADWLEPQAADRALSLPAACYVDPEFEQLECAAVFARGWQLVAHAAQLANPGDHVVAQIGNVPLVIVRGEVEPHFPQGHVRALHNVCRHRAGPVATCDGRAARSLVCAYHGWTYSLDGQCRGAPDMHDALEFDVSAIRLPLARVAEWQGLVFAALDRAGDDDGHEFDELVAGIDARIASHPLPSYAFDGRVSYEIRCNWKVYVDNYLEGYHLPRVHPALNRQLDYRRYCTELADWHSLQSSPLASTAGPYRGRDGGHEALYWWLWPNTMLNVLPQRLQTNRVVPLDTQRCRVDFDYYYAPGAAIADEDRAFADSVQAEDTAICEAVQRGLASGSYVAGRLSPARESGVWHFHQLLRSACRPEVARKR